jgi:hypothetical protein
LDYDPLIQIDGTRQKNGKNFVAFSKQITDYNCRYTSNMLIPGKTYNLKAYAVLKKIYGPRCLSFLIYKKSLLIGAQGLSLVWELKKELFPTGLNIVAFDQRMAQVRIGSSFFIPLIHKETVNGNNFYYFVIEEFADSFDTNCVIFSVKEQKNPA